MSTLLFERSGRDRVVAGVCGGLAIRLAVDATLVRLVFAILALAGGAGILLYLALWVYSDGRRRWPAAALVAVAAATLALGARLLGHRGHRRLLLFAGLAVVLVRGGSLRPGGSLPIAGVVLMMAGAVLFLGRSGASGAFLAPGRDRRRARPRRRPVALAARSRAHRAHPARGAGRGRRPHPRLGPADPRARPAPRRRRRTGLGHRAPPGARAAALALRQRRRGGGEPGRRAGGCSRRRRGAAPRPDRAGQRRRRAARRRRRPAGAGGARGDDQRREVLRRRRDLRLRGGEPDRRVRLRARSRRRLRPRRRRGRSPRDRRVDRGADAARRAARRRSSAPRARAPRSS